MVSAQQLLEYLKHNAMGKDNAIKQSVLADLFQTTPRDIQKLALDLRKADYPVVTTLKNPMGMYYAVVRDEGEEYLSRLRSTALSTLENYNLMKRVMDKNFPKADTLPGLVLDGRR